MHDLLTQIKRAILLVGDIALLYAMLVLALALRYSDLFGQETWSLHFWPFTGLFAVWMVSFYINGLYDTRSHKNDINFYVLILRTLMINAILGVVYFYVFSNRFFSIHPLVVYLINVAVFTVGFLIWRRSYNHMTESNAFAHRVLFLGAAPEMHDLIEELNHKPYLGYQVAGHIPFQNGEGADLDLKKILVEQKIDTVVTALELYKHPQLVAHFYECLFLGISYVDFPVFYERLTGRVPVNAIGQLWFLENLAEKDQKVYELAKRITEIILTFVLGTIGVILSPLIALAIKIDSNGPALFFQERTGKQGRTFKAVKFRTMVVGAERNGPQWAAANDPRTTRVGRFLRKSRLDEIPQLLNILKGEMSFIGPRPERPEFVSELVKKIPFYNERHLIKPGLTGWAQVNFKYGASADDSLKKLQYDLYYIKNRSLLLDAGIVLKTVNTVLTGKGQ